MNKKIKSKFWDMMIGKLKKLATAIEFTKGKTMSIDDPEYRWANDRIEYYEKNGRLLTKEEMKTANVMWKKYDNINNKAWEESLNRGK